MAAAEQLRSKSAGALAGPEEDGRGHADALVQAREEAAEAARLAKAQQAKAEEAEKQAAAAARELELERSKSAKARRAWETERAGFISRGGFAAAIEQVRQQLEAEAAARRQAQADLEKARSDAYASEQIHSKLRQESEALRRELEQFRARGEEQSSQVAEAPQKE